MNNDSQRPSIIVGVQGAKVVPRAAKPLFNGIEEEQIPVAVKKVAIEDVVERAYESALASRLSVGIAFVGNRFVVHYQNLKKDHPLFDEQINDDQQLRILGANAARLVKGIPFKKIVNR